MKTYSPMLWIWLLARFNVFKLVSGRRFSMWRSWFEDKSRRCNLVKVSSPSICWMLLFRMSKSIRWVQCCSPSIKSILFSGRCSVSSRRHCSMPSIASIPWAISSSLAIRMGILMPDHFEISASIPSTHLVQERIPFRAFDCMASWTSPHGGLILGLDEIFRLKYHWLPRWCTQPAVLLLT